MTAPKVDPLSLVPLFLEPVNGGVILGTATGFIVEKAAKSYLITNWHVVTGRDADTGQTIIAAGAVPDEIRIWHHKKGPFGHWDVRSAALLSAGRKPQWLEHPTGRNVDVVALALSIDAGVQLHPMDLALADAGLDLVPSEPVSIIGFPLGLTSGGKLPIWKTGNIASDLDIDYGGKPRFLIDATTKPGMSGSPVVARRRGSWPMKGGGYAIGADDITRFLGVYSSFADQVEIGVVFRSSVIDEILP